MFECLNIFDLTQMKFFANTTGNWSMDRRLGKKEALHQARGYPPTVYKLTPDMFMDPYAQHTAEENEGVWLNHSRFRPNCHVVSVQRQDKVFALLVVAIKNISLGEELVHDYGREDCNSPEFLFY